MAVNDPTTNYAWNLPNVAGDTDAWGGLLNTIIGDSVTGIDAVVKAVSNVANAAVAKAGDTMTGPLIVPAVTEGFTADAPVSGTVTLDLHASNAHGFTVSGATTVALSNLPATGKFFGLLVEVTNGGSAVITWFSGVKTPSAGGLPTLTTSGKDILFFYTHDGGTTWNFIGMQKDVR